MRRTRGSTGIMVSREMKFYSLGEAKCLERNIGLTPPLPPPPNLGS